MHFLLISLFAAALPQMMAYTISNNNGDSAEIAYATDEQILPGISTDGNDEIASNNIIQDGIQPIQVKNTPELENLGSETLADACRMSHVTCEGPEVYSEPPGVKAPPGSEIRLVMNCEQGKFCLLFLLKNLLHWKFPFLYYPCYISPTHSHPVGKRYNLPGQNVLAEYCCEDFRFVSFFASFFPNPSDQNHERFQKV